MIKDPDKKAILLFQIMVHHRGITVPCGSLRQSAPSQQHSRAERGGRFGTLVTQLSFSSLTEFRTQSQKTVLPTTANLRPSLTDMPTGQPNVSNTFVNPFPSGSRLYHVDSYSQSSQVPLQFLILEDCFTRLDYFSFAVGLCSIPPPGPRSG